MSKIEFASLFEFIRNGLSVKQDKSGNGIPVTRIETIWNGKIDFNRVGYAGLNEESNKQWLLQKGDILFSHINSVEHIGKCAVYQGKPDKLIHGMNLLCLRCNDKICIPQYVMYMMRTQAFRDQIGAYINKAVNQASLSIGNLRKLFVTVPPLPEQRRIAAILDKAEELRAKRREAIEKLESLKQAIFLEMFGDPVRNEKGWPVRPIKDMLDSATYGTSEKSTSTGEFPVLRMNNITYAGDMDYRDLKYMELEKADYERYLVKPGDVLFNRTNSAELVGKTGIIREHTSMAYAGYLVRLRVNKNNNPEYLAAFLNTPYAKKRLRGMCKSIIGMANINATEIQAMLIPQPPIVLQNKFARHVATLEGQKKILKTASVKGDNLFSSLQEKAFQGNI